MARKSKVTPPRVAKGKATPAGTGNQVKARASQAVAKTAAGAPPASRRTLVNDIRGFGTFRNASLRLLSDLVERTPAEKVLPKDLGLLIDAAKISFSLYQSLDLTSWKEPQWREGAPTAHLIWMSEQAGVNAPLEALAQLLAAAIAHDFEEEPTAVVVFEGSSVRLAVWENGRFTTSTQRLSACRTQADIRKKLPDVGGKFYHLFFLHPADPTQLPAGFDSEGFDRIVYVTDNSPWSLPEHVRPLYALLKEGAQPNPELENDDPYFSSFIPSMLLTDDQPQQSCPITAPLTPLIRSLTGNQARAFETELVDDECRTALPAPGWRLRRDLCRLRFDPQYLRRQWMAWHAKDRGRGGSFPDWVFNDRPAYLETASRWGRAVTNRQVGLALSGGGASSYRLVPLIRTLHAYKVPIDLVGGVSGGALLGAYYCRDGPTGLSTYVKEGPAFQLFLYGSALTSESMALKVDADLASARVEETEVRFVALTTALPEKHRPEARAVVRGTLGEAVRVSGSMPMGFGRTKIGGTVYTDGASATLIPARALKDFGADMVIACNSLAGPGQGNPFTPTGDRSWWRFVQAAGNFAYEYVPLFGRSIDALVSLAFLLQQASREVEQDAHVYVEPSSDVLPLVESFRFDLADTLANQTRDAELQRKALECQKRWLDFRKSARGTQ